MKSSFVFTIAILSLLVSGVSSPVPKELVIFPDAQTNNDMRVYPLGWSSDGRNVGMLLSYPEQAADERRWKFLVLNLNTNRELFSEIELLDAGMTITNVWKELESKADAICETFGIVRGESELHPFPACRGGGIYEARLSIERGKDSDLGSLGIRSMQTVFTVDGDRSQIVGVEEWKTWMPLAAGIVGGIPNAAGDGLVVVVGVVKRGFEGPPHTRELFFYSALAE